MGEKVAILDAGAQYGKVIDRRVRELNVETDILPLDTSSETLKLYKAIIISGGPESVYGENAPAFNTELFNLSIPVLGICYGMQLMNYVSGGAITKKDRREDGPCDIRIEESPLFGKLATSQDVLMSHGDSIDTLADGFEPIAYSGKIIAGVQNKEKKLYGVQFHPEVDLTVQGKQILRNFLYDIAGLSGDYTLQDREQTAIDYIQKTVGDNDVLVLVSGGVDSTVCAALLYKALGRKKVHAIHIDNGFMRLNESKRVKEALEEIGLDLKVIDASEDFYNGTTLINSKRTARLKYTISPEEKRKIIGDTFMRVAEKYIPTLGLDPEKTYLAQGTLRPDLIESASKLASGKAGVIKTHHNDTELVRKLRDAGKVIEPLKDYHKDEVRKLGESLGLPTDLLWRQPFPGPGLGVRIICAEKPYDDGRFDDISEKLKQYSSNKISAVLLPIQTVGVQGDGRTYSYLAGLSGEKDWDSLFRLAREIPKGIHGINRVVYIFGDKIESQMRSITPTYPTKDVIAQLQQADDIVNKALLDYDLIKKLSQVPVISFPVDFGIKGNRSIGIRTFITNDFMTGVPAFPGKDMPEEALETMVKQILSKVSGISRVVYDLTSKPPGTTEWE